jgi:hypothetical protein
LLYTVWRTIDPGIAVQLGGLNCENNMFCGHYAAALYFRTMVPPSASLPMLFIASQAQDILLAVFAYILHLDTVTAPDATSSTYPSNVRLVNIPYSHSLFTTVALVGIVQQLSNSQSVYGMATASHWFLDALVLYPAAQDLCWPLLKSCPKISLGLGRSVYLAVALESTLIIACALLYTQRSRLGTGPSVHRTWAQGLTLVLVQAMLVLTLLAPSVRPLQNFDAKLALSTIGCHFVFAGFAGVIELNWARARRQFNKESGVYGQ